MSDFDLPGASFVVRLSLSRFLPNSANPSFGTLLNNLNIRIAGSRKEFAMLVDTQEIHASFSRVFFASEAPPLESSPDGRPDSKQLGHPRCRSLVDFRRYDEPPSRLQDSEDFAHVPWQVRPPDVRVHSCHKIEHRV